MKTIMITGSSSGIGLAAAGQFLSDGNKVIMLCREGEKAQVARESLLETTGCSEESIDLVFADLGSRNQIQTAIQDISDRYEEKLKEKLKKEGLSDNSINNIFAGVNGVPGPGTL